MVGPSWQRPTRRHILVFCVIMVAVAFLVLVFFGNPGDTRNSGAETSESRILVRAEEFGERWPLTVPSGFIIKHGSADGLGAVIFEAPDGIKYGLNGFALSEGYANIHEITKRRLVSGASMYEDVSRLIDIGLQGKNGRTVDANQ